MDWLEEKAEQIKKYIRQASLERSLFCYLAIMLCSVWVLGILTTNLCSSWLGAIQERYPDIIVQYGMFFWYVDNASQKIQCLLNVIFFLYRYNSYLYLIFGISIVTKVYYRNKIAPARDAIEEAVRQISVGDYGQNIGYCGEDELGQLCQGFEKMRKLLIQEKKGQWRQQENQRRINSAFAHDMRTPLTVIKGYTEFLEKYVPEGKVSNEKIMEKLQIMKFQEERLLEFSKTMSRIQKMEDWELSCDWITPEKIADMISQCVEGIRENARKKITFTYRCGEKKVYADSHLILEVFENLLHNALRYAASEVWVELSEKEEALILFVRDDGPGFTDGGLHKAVQVYYTEEENSSEHFGLGLSICTMLCEKHGGRLNVGNSAFCGAVVSAEFRV